MTVPVLFYLSERKKYEPPPIEPPLVAELSSDGTEISEAETAVEESNGRPANVTVIEPPTQAKETVVELSSTNSNVSETRP
jgi:hypothetical protein